MEIMLQYFDGCPHWEAAYERLQTALRQAGLDAEIRVRLQPVDSPEAAERLGFRGSPTFHFDGVDPFSGPSAPTGLACRFYRTNEHVEGAPTVAQLLAAITNARRWCTATTPTSKKQA